jgi:hypothetical protein
MFGRRVRRRSDGRYSLRLAAHERELLRSLPDDLLALLDTDDPSLQRLFPPAYGSADDAALEAEYRQLMGSDLADRHRAALVVLRDTVDAEVLDEEQMVAWLAGLNELRLVLGTRLDVSEDEDTIIDAIDPDDPRGMGLALYQYLGGLQQELVEAAAGAF